MLWITLSTSCLFSLDYGAVPEDELAVMAEAFLVFWVIINYVHSKVISV